MICPRCGKELLESETFCSNCGTPVTNLEEQVTSEMQAVSQNYGPYKLTLRRPKSFVGCLVAYKIYIDNQKVGKIKNGGTFEIELPAGNHSISLNKNNAVNIMMDEDTTADVAIFGTNNVGITNVSGQSNADTNAQIGSYTAKSGPRTDGLLVLSIILPIASFIMYQTMQYIIMPWVYGIIMGLSIVNLVGLKNQNLSKEEHQSAFVKNCITIAVSLVAAIVSINIAV